MWIVCLYHPLDNEFQIREAIHDTCDLINSKESIFEKALLTLVLLSYIQPLTTRRLCSFCRAENIASEDKGVNNQGGSMAFLFYSM